MKNLHPLSPKQAADAEVIYGLARALDVARAEGNTGSANAANARALSSLADKFRERGSVMPAAPVDNPPQSNVDSADEVAAKRAARRNQGRQTG